MDRLDFAIKLSRKVGKVLLSEWGNPLKVGTKTDFQDLVTDMDELSQRMIVDAIKEEFPKDGILSEEGIDERKEGYWVVDPIDGTVNYAFGLPSFSISIAYVEKDEAKIGVVHIPTLDQTYYASKGLGAFLNGERINVSKRRDLRKTVGLLGFFKNFTSKVFERLENDVVRLRILGSVAVAVVYVAAGKADFAIVRRANIWDIAAGRLIIEEAGGKVTDLSGKPVSLVSKNGFLFSNGLVHEEILQRLKNL